MDTVFSADGSVPIEVASNIMSYLPNADLNKMALMNSHCEYVSRITFIQYRISKWFFKNLTAAKNNDDGKDGNDEETSGNDKDNFEEENNRHGNGELNVMNMTAQSYFSFFVLRVMIPIKRHIIGTNEQRHRFLKCPPLHYLINLGLESEVLFKHLIQRSDIDVNEVDKCHKNALHALCACQHFDKIHTAYELLELLLESGIDVTALAAKNELAYERTLTCLDFAAQTKKYGVIKRLLTLPNSWTLVSNSSDPMGPLWADIDKDFNNSNVLDEISTCMELIVENGYVWKNHRIFLPNHSVLMKKAVQLGLFNHMGLTSWLVERYICHIFQLGDLELYQFVEQYITLSTSSEHNNRLFDPRYNPYLLHYASTIGHLPLVIHVAKSNKDNLNSLQFYEGHRYSPLHLAILKGKSLECVKHLVQLGANVALTAGDGRSCASLAAASGCLDILDYLVSHCGCSLESQQTRGIVTSSPLMSAVASTNKEVVQYIIEHRLEHSENTIEEILSEHTALSQNIFHLVCRLKVHDPRKIFPLIKYLFSFPCSQKLCTQGDECYTTPRSLSKTFMPFEIQEYIEWYLQLNPLEQQLATSENGTAKTLENLDQSALKYICRSGDLDSFNYFLGKYPEWFNKEKFRLCKAAALGGNRRILETLLSYLNDTEIAKFDWGVIMKQISKSPVSEEEVIANIQLLALFVLQHCPHANLFNLNIRAQEDCPKWMQSITSDTISQYLQSIMYYSHILHMYIHINDTESASELLRKDRTGLTKRCYNGRFTAIHIACQRGSIEMIKLLSEYGAVIDYSCLRCAASAGHIDIVKFVYRELLKSTDHITLTASDINKQNILHSILYGGIGSVEQILSILQFFIARGAAECISMPDAEGCTPLAIAAMIDPSISQYLSAVLDMKKVLTVTI